MPDLLSTEDSTDTVEVYKKKKRTGTGTTGWVFVIHTVLFFSTAMCLVLKWLLLFSEKHSSYFISISKFNKLAFLCVWLLCGILV